MAQLIINEVPVGVINSVNKVFTAVFDIGVITDIIVDGVDYFDYSISGKIITLADAPTTAIHIDYMTSGFSSNPSLNIVTVGDVKNRIREEMEQNSNSTTYNAQRLLDMINEVRQEIIEGKVSNELTGKYIQSNVQKFNTGKFANKIINNIAIQGDITTSSVEILLDTTNLPNAGAIMIGDEIISYTGKTSTKITGISGVLVEHQSGEITVPLYNTNNDFRKASRVYKHINGINIEIQNCNKDIYQQKYFKTVSYNNVNYMYYCGVAIGDIYYVEYTKVYYPLLNDFDIVNLNDNISLNILPFICGGRLIKDPELRLKLLTQGYNKIYTEFVKLGEDMGKPNSIGRKRFGFSSIN